MRPMQTIGDEEEKENIYNPIGIDGEIEIGFPFNTCIVQTALQTFREPLNKQRIQQKTDNLT